MDWEEVAQTALAMFRADTTEYAGEPEFERLLSYLLRSSEEFREWWPRRDVLRRLSSPKRIYHPACGPMAFENTAFAVLDETDLKPIVDSPLPEEDTATKFKRLLAGDGHLSRSR